MITFIILFLLFLGALYVHFFMMKQELRLLKEQNATFATKLQTVELLIKKELRNASYNTTTTTQAATTVAPTTSPRSDTTTIQPKPTASQSNTSTPTKPKVDYVPPTTNLITTAATSLLSTFPVASQISAFEENPTTQLSPSNHQQSTSPSPQHIQPSSPSSPPQTLHESYPSMTGNLEIQGKLNTFTERYFVLKEGWLSYYKSKKAKEANGFFKLNQTVKVDRLPGPEHNVIRISQLDSTQDLYHASGPTEHNFSSSLNKIWRDKSVAILRSKSDAEINSWIQAINKTIQLAGTGLEPDAKLKKNNKTLMLLRNKSKVSNLSSGDSRQTSVYNEDDDTMNAENSHNSQLLQDEGEREHSSDNVDGEKASSTAAEDEAAVPEYEFTEDQLLAIEEVAERLKQSPLLAKKKLSNYTIFRFLTARQLDVDKAVEMLRNRIEWEFTYKPHLITADEVKVEILKRKAWWQGVDKLSRPVLIVKPGLHNKNDCDNTLMIKFIVYTMEVGIARMKEGVNTFVVLCDLSGVGTHCIDIGFIKQTSKTLEDYYPERMACCVCVYTPKLFNLLWSPIKVVLEERTVSKIDFLHDPEGLWDPKSQWSKVFNRDQTPAEFGGLSKWTCDNDSVY